MTTRFWLATGLTGAALVLLAVAGQQAGGAPMPAMLAWSPTTPDGFDYGRVNGCQTAPQEFTLTNSGSSASGTLTIDLSTSPAFSITADGCTGKSLGPSKTCSVTVEYSPTMADPENANLSATGTPASASIGLIGNLRHIYWNNSRTGTIGRAALDGTYVNQRFITASLQCRGVAVDAKYIYWTNTFNGMSIGRAYLNGSNVNQNFITLSTQPFGMALNANHIYWANNFTHTIGRANLNGSNANESFITGAIFPTGVAVDADYLYWASNRGDRIGRANLNGTDPFPFIGNTDGVVNLAVDANYIYWGTGDPATIGRADINGSNVNQNFITPADSVEGVAVDANHIYWSNLRSNTIGRADLNGMNVNQNFITGASFPASLALDQ
jgi:virginiamycin B lyase